MISFNSTRVQSNLLVNIHKMIEYRDVVPTAVSTATLLTRGASLKVSTNRTRRAKHTTKTKDDSHEHVIAEHIKTEIANNRYRDVSGEEHQYPAIFLAPLITIEQTDKIRVCHDLSRPPNSVNGDINPADRRVTYQDINVALRYINEMANANGADSILMSKFDIKSAYRLIPVRPEDAPLQGCRFRGRSYIDMALSFGGASAPAIFDEFGNTVQDILTHELRAKQLTEVSFRLIRYVDDMLLITKRDETQTLIHTFYETMSQLNIKLKTSKTETATNTLTFLGIEISIEQRMLRIPRDKSEKLLKLIEDTISSGTIAKRQADELLGKMTFLAIAIPELQRNDTYIQYPKHPETNPQSQST